MISPSVPSPEASSLAAALRALETADSSPKLIAAVRAVASYRDPQAIPALMSALGYNNPGAAVAAVEGLVALGAAAVEPILAHLDGYNYSARAWAVRALAQLADPRALDVLLAAAEDFAPSVRRAAARGLGAIAWDRLPEGDRPAAQSRVLAMLTPLSEDLEWVARYGAIVGLSKFAAAPEVAPGLQEEAIALLRRRSVEDPDRAVRLRAQWALQP